MYLSEKKNVYRFVVVCEFVRRSHYEIMSHFVILKRNFYFFEFVALVTKKKNIPRCRSFGCFFCWLIRPRVHFVMFLFIFSIFEYVNHLNFITFGWKKQQQQNFGIEKLMDYFVYFMTFAPLNFLTLL